MIKKRFRLVILSLLLSLIPTMKAQIPAILLPNSMKENAFSVVQEDRTEIVCDSPVSATIRRVRIVTVLNSKGEDAANFTCSCDRFVSLQKFSAEICNAYGQVVRKIKKADLKMTEYSTSLATDNYTYYYECSSPSYPYTVKYEWDMKDKNGLIGFYPFMPQIQYYQSVMKASYSLQTPADFPCRYKAIHTDVPVERETTESGDIVTKVSLDSLKAIEIERFNPDFGEIVPYIYFAPTAFTYDGSQGEMDTWKNFGIWQKNLLVGRAELTDETKAKLHALTDGYTTKREKVKAIYDYLGETTRYVSIQLGIGGLQPIAAADVCRAGFGDCKGLSNYARAMLRELGIDSHYTAISTTNERLLSDFASANQMNHVILQVPLEGDTLWLECTAPQSVPFGYVSSNIAGHDALLIDEEGGKLCRLPMYPDSLNTQDINASITLTPTGAAKIEVCETYRLAQYESAVGIKQLPLNKQKDVLRSGIKLPQGNIGAIRFDEKKEAYPEIAIHYTVDSELCGNKTGNRLFIPANIFRPDFGKLPAKERKYDIDISYGYADSDNITFKIPEGYVVEALPKAVSIEARFGTFRSLCQVIDANTILFTSRLYMKRGLYPAKEYAEFSTFYNSISKQYNGKIILRKE